MQAIKRGKSFQWFINFPAAIAAAMDFEKSEIVEWEIIDKNTLRLKRKVSKSILRNLLGDRGIR